jgi:L-rhamnose isomerase/sugar isomerase
MDRTALIDRLRRQQVETPSWGFAVSGTRFGRYPQPGAASSLAEKLADAGTAHRYTGILPRVALHIPWDASDDWEAVRALAAEHGVGIGAINPNLFQDPCFEHGSLCHPEAAVRRKALDRCRECLDICAATGSRTLGLWLADGTDYPGQDCFRARRRRLAASLGELYRACTAAGVRLLIEYKPFEPACYHTDLGDWGIAALLCRRLGPGAQVLVDTGHHPLGANIEWIVAGLLDEGLLGGFHFNSRKYADDDLTVGSHDPHQLFLIHNELAAAAEDADPAVRACAEGVVSMFDQSHRGKNPVEATIQSACAVQEALAKALLVDRTALAGARAARDTVRCEEILKDAWASDVRPLLREVRARLGVPEDPLAAFRASGHAARSAAERRERHGEQALACGGGFQ